MKLIESIRRRLASIGGTLDDGEYTLNLDAPSGYVWRANGEPNYPIHYATNSQSWLAKALREEADALNMGLEKVTDAKRLEEIQWNLGDDDWIAAPDAPMTLEWPRA